MHIPRSQAQTIAVTGEGKVSVQPDEAVIDIGVTTEGKNLTAAQQENSQTISQITHSLLKLGISQENIQTSEYRIIMEYDYVDGTQVFRGYNVTHILEVTIKDINRTGIVVDTAVRNGATTVSNIRFTASQRNRFYNHALAMAVQDAQQKAITIARSSGNYPHLQPISVSEGGVEAQPYQREKVLAASTETTPISPGLLEITATVRVKFIAHC